MRAIYYPNLATKFETLLLSNDKAKYLIKVVRIKLAEELKLLDGKGRVTLTKVIGISKKEIQLEFVSSQLLELHDEIDLLVGKVKKDAMDLIIKMAVELGITKLIMAKTEHSQQYPLKSERVDSLIESAIEQSNNPYLLKIEESSLGEVDFAYYDFKLCFSSEYEKALKLNHRAKRTLLIVGPEGGFSREEEDFIDTFVDGKIHLDSPIMRTPTAVACGVGLIQGLRR
jgi:16S rRNA (uracil1498-N3)-methyltransferase